MIPRRPTGPRSMSLARPDACASFAIFIRGLRVFRADDDATDGGYQVGHR
jgi:hypothetical protein